MRQLNVLSQKVQKLPSLVGAKLGYLNELNKTLSQKKYAVNILIF